MLKTPWDVVEEAAVVFVATDLDVPQCDEALRYADVEARARGDTLVVCQLRSWMRATAQDELAALTAYVANTTQRKPSTFTVETASRARAIIARAESHGAELIVVCAPDRNRFAFGLVRRIVRYARCPVLVVRPPYGLTTLVATDLVDDLVPTISAAAREAPWIDARITTLLHCARTTTTANEAMHRLATLAQQHSLGAEVSIATGAPAEGIVNAAFEIGADLVIIATHGRTGLSRFLQPSVAEAVVRRAPGSVLVVRRDAISSRKHLAEVPS